MSRQVQLHMGAIRQLLDVCQTKGTYLSDGIKRAIFWLVTCHLFVMTHAYTTIHRQDLNSSVMTGSNRVVDHTTFAELQWKRDPCSPNFFTLPPGFQTQSELLGPEFVEVLKDVYALQRIRDTALFGAEDEISMARIDSHQASIQSRLVSLPNGSSILECCHLAAYLCSAMLRCKLWRASTIPVSQTLMKYTANVSLLSVCAYFECQSHLSLQLLCKLQQIHDDITLDTNLLVWLLYIGGAFSPAGAIRSGYVELLYLNRSIRFQDLNSTWPGVLEILKQFIWSEKAFTSQVKAFWKEVAVNTS